MKAGDKAVQVNLPLEVYDALKALADRERRAMGPQAAVMLEELLGAPADPEPAGGKGRSR